MTPEAPRIIRTLVDLIHPNVFFLGIKSNLKTLHGLRAAPQDAGDSIFDSLPNSPFFYASGEGGLVDRRRLVIACQLGRALLHRAKSKLLHLRGGRRVVRDSCNLIQPFNTSTAIPAGHDQANWGTVVSRERLPVHFGGQEGSGGMNVVERENPARTGCRGYRRRSIAIEAGDQNARVLGNRR